MPTEQSDGSGFSSEVQSSRCVQLTAEANYDSVQDYKTQTIQQNCQECKEVEKRSTETDPEMSQAIDTLDKDITKTMRNWLHKPEVEEIMSMLLRDPGNMKKIKSNSERDERTGAAQRAN